MSRLASKAAAADLLAVIGWGLKDNTQKARAFACRHDLPYLSLEDGFIRSVGLGVDGAEPFAFIVDRTGIYYDARQPSDVEVLIKAAGQDDQQRAREVIDRIVAIQASKYNHVWTSPVLPIDSHPNILLIDQAVGDQSVRYGLADANSFKKMVRTALQRYPTRTLFC
jgi:capsular polysaccharide export protein